MDTFEYIRRNNNGTFKKIEISWGHQKITQAGQKWDRNTELDCPWTMDQIIDDFVKEWKARHGSK